ncbi:uncharacterized protein LOC105779023 [Gossypium raimondii]|uniref:uncharacterized protein LOC105779023 n=1 Tax=Gossypium raimondii TaxID=29730 RepID=UPI00063AD627|nr:uncharacterized protein LOC105779023 [Gossypium raimondii]
MTTVNSIRLLRENFSESRVVEKVITTLPEKFELKISSLEDSRDLSAISLSELINSLYALEQRRGNTQEDHPEGAFQARANEGSSSNQKGNKPWHNRREKPRKKEGKRFGHVKKVCKGKGKEATQQQAQAAEDLRAQEEHVFTASCFASTSRVRSDCCLKILTKVLLQKIRIGDGNLIEAKGKGNVMINTCSGNKIISNVLFVPDIDQNLLSVGQLVEKAYTLVFRNGSCIVEDSLGHELVTVALTDRCFMLDVSQIERKAYTSLADSTGLWHKRLGHANFKSLDLLHRLNLVDNMSKVEVNNTVCEKSEVFEAFGKFKALVENQAGCKIKTLRTDNGTEYLSERFQKLCEQAGIHHQ